MSRIKQWQNKFTKKKNPAQLGRQVTTQNAHLSQTLKNYQHLISFSDSNHFIV